jgi:hypothetical protein
MASEGEDLFLEVLAQFAERQVVELLQFGLVSQRLHERLTEAILEVAADEGADAVLLCSLFRLAVGVAERALELFLCSDGLSGFVFEFEREVAQDPVERGEVALNELLVVGLSIRVFELDVLGQVEDQVEVLDGGLVNSAV